MESARQRGRHWERYAETWLRARGLQPVARNVNCRFGEIDLVLLDGSVMVFVEVRYRRVDRYGSGADSVTVTKQRRLIRAAGYFLNRHRQHRHRPCRFDVVSMSAGRDAPEVDWIRDAFQAG